MYIACFPNREDNSEPHLLPYLLCICTNVFSISVLQFQHKTQGVSPEFGPFACTISSNEFIVAAPVSLSMNLLAVPRDLTIYALNVYIQQYVTIAPSSSTETHTVASSKAYILREGSTSGYATEGFATAARDQGLIVLDGQHMQGECWDWSRIARLVCLCLIVFFSLKSVWFIGSDIEPSLEQPMSDKIRPTTLPGTDSPLRFQSELVFEIVFSREPAEVANPKIKIATLFNKRVTIAS